MTSSTSDATIRIGQEFLNRAPLKISMRIVSFFWNALKEQDSESRGSQICRAVTWASGGIASYAIIPALSIPITVMASRKIIKVLGN